MLRIKADYTKCTGCRQCEVVCSLQHKENTINPKTSRIRVFMKDDLFFPVIAGPYTEAECNARAFVTIGDREYDECWICRASCPVKPWFKEPDTEIPLKCDFCGEPPDPQCVKWCFQEALTLVEVPD